MAQELFDHFFHIFLLAVDFIVEFAHLLVGDASKAKKILGWEPKVRFNELVRVMVDADMKLLSLETPRKHLGKLP